MVILGFMFNYMLRVNLTIAIVEMVYNPNTNTNSTSTTDSAATNSSVTSSTNVSESENAVPSNKFLWDKYDQNRALGCFFWGYLLTELPGGRLAELIGAKWVFGGGMLGASVLTLLTPAASYIHVWVLIVLRR